ncbi:disulfide bond formation protein B [Paracoccus pacificus]|uniref:Disulfide bond formation protein B n=1 Tax=Paracoccus pacificus TaxID=1463598 RepID=A0ABW4RAK5_9RHOB
MIAESFSSRRLMVGAGAGSAAMLLFAIASQIMGYAPCELCILQRWPHLVAVIIGALALFVRPRRIWAAVGALAIALGTAIAFYHAGVEQQWWAGPTQCSGMVDFTTMSTGDLLAQIEAAPLVRCDQISWSLFGLSMAAWNGILSVGLLGMWILALLRAPR